jgi:hypothetical protein
MPVRIAERAGTVEHEKDLANGMTDITYDTRIETNK